MSLPLKIIEAGYKNTYIKDPMMLYRDDKKNLSIPLGYDADILLLVKHGYDRRDNATEAAKYFPGLVYKAKVCFLHGGYYRVGPPPVFRYFRG